MPLNTYNVYQALSGNSFKLKICGQNEIQQ